MVLDLRGLRESRGIRQRELARMVGVQPDHMSRIENGQRRPSHDVVLKIADALGCKPIVVYSAMLNTKYAKPGQGRRREDYIRKAI